jgi:hypothetical protein
MPSTTISYCETCGSDPCRNPSFCQACREADRRRASRQDFAHNSTHLDARNQIRGIIRTIAGARAGERDQVTFWASCRFAELVQQSAISEGDAIDIIIEAASRAGLHYDEARRTAASAFRAIGI